MVNPRSRCGQQRRLAVRAIGLAQVQVGEGYSGLIPGAVFAATVRSAVKTLCMVAMIVIGAGIYQPAPTFSGTSREVGEWVLILGRTRVAYVLMRVAIAALWFRPEIALWLPTTLRGQ